MNKYINPSKFIRFISCFLLLYVIFDLVSYGLSIDQMQIDGGMVAAHVILLSLIPLATLVCINILPALLKRWRKLAIYIFLPVTALVMLVFGVFSLVYSNYNFYTYQGGWLVQLFNQPVYGQIINIAGFVVIVLAMVWEWLAVKKPRYDNPVFANQIQRNSVIAMVVGLSVILVIDVVMYVLYIGWIISQSFWGSLVQADYLIATILQHAIVLWLCPLLALLFWSFAILYKRSNMLLGIMLTALVIVALLLTGIVAVFHKDLKCIFYILTAIMILFLSFFCFFLGNVQKRNIMLYRERPTKKIKVSNSEIDNLILTDDSGEWENPDIFKRESRAARGLRSFKDSKVVQGLKNIGDSRTVQSLKNIKSTKAVNQSIKGIKSAGKSFKNTFDKIQKKEFMAKMKHKFRKDKLAVPEENTEKLVYDDADFKSDYDFDKHWTDDDFDEFTHDVLDE